MQQLDRKKECDIRIDQAIKLHPRIVNKTRQWYKTVKR